MMTLIGEALKHRAIVEDMAQEVPDNRASHFSTFYPLWLPDNEYSKAGFKVRDDRGVVYSLITPHMSMIGREPATTPALWAKVLTSDDGVPLPWEQPIGSTNPYGLGDRVTHKGWIWESESTNNVWEPGALGAPWKQIEEVKKV